MATLDAGSASPVASDNKGDGEKSQVQALSISESQGTDAPAGGYRLYKRRWIGVFVLVRNIYCTGIGFRDSYHRCSLRWRPSRACPGHGSGLSPLKVRSQPWRFFDSILNFLCAVNKDMGYNIDRVDWLGNMIACAYLVIAFQVPLYVRHFGVRKTVCIVTSHHPLLLMYVGVIDDPGWRVTHHIRLGPVRRYSS